MHHESMQLMIKALYRLKHPEGALVLDVGSYNVNGSYRELVETCGAVYLGIDTRQGPNVDMVVDTPYRYPFNDDQFDAVIAGNMLHNVAHPWKLVPELARILKPGGLLAIVTIWNWGLNSHPIDYFRFTDQGLRVLFDETDDLDSYEFAMDERGNTMGTAIKQ